MIFAPIGFSRVLPSNCEVCENIEPLTNFYEGDDADGMTCDFCGTVHLGILTKNENLPLVFKDGVF